MAFGARDPLSFNRPTASAVNKGRYTGFVDVPKRCAIAHAAVKRRGSKRTTILKESDKTGVNLAAARECLKNGVL